MDGVVSLLPQPFYDQVYLLWDQLERDFGLRGIKATPYPHFSWQIADCYDSPRLKAVLEALAARTRPFKVETAGLGLFTGGAPVLYIPLIVSSQLTDFHRLVWQTVDGLGTGVSPYYAPDHWIPHISLANEDLTPDLIGPVTRALVPQKFDWEFEVNNFSFIYASCDSTGELMITIPFTG